MGAASNFVSFALCLAVIMLTDWSLWISVPVGLIFGGLAAQVMEEYLPKRRMAPVRQRPRMPPRYS